MTFRIALAAPLVVLSLSVSPDSSSARMKETVGVYVTAPSPHKRVVVNASGLRVFLTSKTSPQFGGTPVVRDTLTTPFFLAVAGVGTLSLKGVDTGVKYTAQMEGLYGSSTPATTVTAAQIEISHPDVRQAYSMWSKD
jgi:hypothetical protein